ncbi:MAG TPA: preprotein translocase subunit YajC [Trebonia sp.]|nr:preprotein translocase subunit YajC [Trebonia sp.]
MGISVLAAASKSSGGSSSFTFILFIVVIFAALYFLMIRPQQRRRQQAASQQNNVAPGARVRTTAGMYATVVDVDGDDVILEVAPGIEVRYMKRAIMDVVSPGETPAEYEEESGYAADEQAEDEADGVTGEVADADASGTEADDVEAEEDAETAYEKATGSKQD